MNIKDAIYYYASVTYPHDYWHVEFHDDTKKWEIICMLRDGPDVSKIYDEKFFFDESADWYQIADAISQAVFEIYEEARVKHEREHF